MSSPPRTDQQQDCWGSVQEGSLHGGKGSEPHLKGGTRGLRQMRTSSCHASRKAVVACYVHAGWSSQRLPVPVQAFAWPMASRDPVH